MSATDAKNFLVDQITIVEWYDGVVRGILTCQGEYYLLALVAWEWSSKKKAFVLLNLDRTTAEEMKRLTGSDNEDEKLAGWKEFNQIFAEYINRYEGPTYLLSKEPEKGKTFSATPISSDHLKHLQDYDLENTLSPSAQAFWFLH